MAAASSSVADHQRFFKFIFLARSWASDRANLTKALKNLSANAKGTNTIPGSSKDGEDSSLLDKTTSKKSSGRSPLWLFIFPEGTITSDDERVKSKRYADKEGIVRLFLFPLTPWLIHLSAFPTYCAMPPPIYRLSYCCPAVTCHLLTQDHPLDSAFSLSLLSPLPRYGPR
jgi:1-acyl-sn-glycerol-3-phosphate acyltransferase